MTARETIFRGAVCPVMLALAGAVLVLPAAGQVVINELVAANSDRQLRRDTPGYPRLGVTAQWHEDAFDDSQWPTGNGPFGFGSFSGVTFGVNTSAAMQNKTPSLYLRKTFTATEAQAALTSQIQLVTRFNYGFIAFLNGVEVARSGMGNPGMFAYRDQTAFNTNMAPNTAVTFDLGAAQARLRPGQNQLCIQTHNRFLTGGNFLAMHDLRIAGTPSVSLVTNSAPWKYFVGVAEPSGGIIDYGILAGIPATVTWATLGFNDSAWEESDGPIGFDTKNPPNYILGANLKTEMYGKASSVYTRVLFSATPDEAASDEPLRLELDYDDGVIVYLNGLEVARRNVGTANTITPCNALATTGHNANGDGGATGREEYLTLGPANTLLAGGDNVLCLQTHNSSLTSSDLICRATLSTSGAGARILSRPTDPCRFFIGTREPQEAEGEDAPDAEYEQDTPDSESDWVELHNAGDAAVNLTGWSLTDDAGKPRKWYFPPGSTIPARGYLLVLATGFDVGPANGANYLHTNFKLSAGGEYLGLVNASGAIVDELAPAFPAQSYFHTYARDAQGVFGFCDTATPGSANTGTFYAAITAPPVFSHLGGFYPSAFSLQLTPPVPDAEIRYTLDGSEPSASSTPYAAPLAITTNTALRARCFKPGELPSDTVTHTYLINPSAARRSIPAICLTADPVLSLYGPNAKNGPANGEGIMAIKGGIYYAHNPASPTDKQWINNGDLSAFNMPMLRSRASEKPAVLEYYPTNGVPLRTGFGLRLSGSGHARPRYGLAAAPAERFTPNVWSNKPSFNFFFRAELGASEIDYPFFGASRVTTFGDMRLRAGKNDPTNPFIRDEYARRLFLGTGQKGSIGNFSSLYINGVWKGYYNFCEHLREAFMQQHHNSAALWDVRQVGEFASGDAIHWNRMIAFVRTNDNTSAQAYARVADYLDADNYIDYIAVNAFAAMWDWPNNNWVAARERSAAGRWRFYMWDAEGCFGMNSRTTAYNTFTNDLIITDAKTTTSRYIPALYTLLRVSPEFRLRFADRIQKHFFNDGCMTKPAMQATFTHLRDTINPIMKETVNAFVNESFYNTWVVDDTRRITFFDQLRTQNLWPATLAPEFSHAAGIIPPGTAVTLGNPNGAGTVYYTTNGVDPRALGGAAVGTPCAAPVLLPATTTLKARVLSPGGEWSPLQEAQYLVPVALPAFQPTGSADWTADANWTSTPLPYPHGPNAAALLNAPTTADRNVNIRAPVTVGSVFVKQEDSAYRNRIRDQGIGNTLTFASTNGPALLTVEGTGTGYVEFEVAAGVVLASDLKLTVNNTAGSAEHGALRLRAGWSGPGGLIKEGDGVASLTGEGKAYTGPTVINQGVLQVTEPASPSASSGLAVTPGGQLRLISASTEGVPRVYGFGGTLSLDSTGRSGVLPASGQGVAGGLRFQPETDNSVAVVTNALLVEGLSGIHVEGSRNTLELTGPLSGFSGLIKSGGGRLVLSGTSDGYLQPVTVSNGTLDVRGPLASSVTLEPAATLSGTASAGPLLGTGTVALDRTILSAPIALGLNYAFSFSTRGSPAYADPAASGNGVLRLFSAYAAGAWPLIDIYLDVADLAEGDRLRGGLFVELPGNLTTFLDAATVRFFTPDPSGTHKLAGRAYSPYLGLLPLAATAVPERADFADGTRHGWVIEVRAGAAPLRYAEWADAHYPGQSGSATLPAANATNGLPNLLLYAFGFTPGAHLPDFLPRLSLADGLPSYRFRFDPGKRDLAYRVEASADLRLWDRVLFDSRTDWPAAWDGDALILDDSSVSPETTSKQFYRLRVFLNTP